MIRMLNLVLFELKKILNHRKAFLFLLVLNVVPIIASLVLLITYLSCKGFGFGDFQFIAMKKTVQALFTGHFTLFGYIAPFFLALIVGDSFSTEFGRGYMKMLLITPVKRWQVITAKAIAIMTFLLIAVALGGLVLQGDLLIARGMTQPSGLMPNNLQTQVMDTSLSMVTVKSALELGILAFVANSMMIGFLIVFSMFFESPIPMAFCSLSGVMAIQVFYISSGILKGMVEWFEPVSKFCFTRHFFDLFSMKVINNILSEKETLLSDSILQNLGYSVAWAIVFFLLSVFIFSRKQILH